MKNAKILSLAFLAAGTLVLALLLQMAGRVDVAQGGAAYLASAIRDGDPEEQGVYCYQNGTVKV